MASITVEWQPLNESREGSNQGPNNVPLLDNQLPAKSPKTPTQKAVRKVFKGSAHLQNLLPTGSVLVFQIISPVITLNGECHSVFRQILTLGFLILCGMSCFVLCFTDSFRDERGKVRHGVATFRGLRIIDGPPGYRLPPDEDIKFRLKFVDFVHAAMSIVVFAALAMFDKNVSKCFFPSPSEDVEAILTALPVMAGVICSMLIVLFPSKRHGIGFPLSRH